MNIYSLLDMNQLLITNINNYHNHHIKNNNNNYIYK